MAKSRCELDSGSATYSFVCYSVHWPPEVQHLVLSLPPNRLYEVNIGLIVGCMPILPLLFKHGPGFKKTVTYILAIPTRLLSNRGSYPESSRTEPDSKNTQLPSPFDDDSINRTPRHYIEPKNQNKDVREPVSVV